MIQANNTEKDMTTETEDGVTSADAINMDRLARVYIKMRDKLAQLTREYEEAEAAIKAQQAEIAAAMKDIIQNAGAKSISTSHGTVTLKTSTRYYAQDWDAMYRFIVERDAAFLLEKRIAQRNMQDYLEQNPGDVPPGLNTMSELSISVTKPRK